METMYDADCSLTEGWVENPDFEEVPLELLTSATWSEVGAGGWSREEGISILESRALLRSLQRASWHSICCGADPSASSLTSPTAWLSP